MFSGELEASYRLDAFFPPLKYLENAPVVYYRDPVRGFPCSSIALDHVNMARSKVLVSDNVLTKEYT